MPLLTPTGGLVYHARALRAGRRWRPFREALAAWLDDWTPPCDRLLIVGPSGGYTLPTAWLSRFATITAIDFDPLAPRLFARRHPGVEATWIIENVLPADPGGIDLGPLRTRLDERPDHIVLFANVLGQLGLTARDPDAVEASLVDLRALLHGRTWASVHDRLSSPVKPRLPSDRRHRDDRTLATVAYAAGEVVSHSTARLGEGLDCAAFVWECAPGWWHLIEACREEP